MKTISLRLDDVLHKKFKMMMVKKEKTMQDCLIEWIEEALRKEQEESGTEMQ